MAKDLLPCPFCGSQAATPDANDFTWCSSISCFEGWMHVDTWNSRTIKRWGEDPCDVVHIYEGDSYVVVRFNGNCTAKGPLAGDLINFAEKSED